MANVESAKTKALLRWLTTFDVEANRYVYMKFLICYRVECIFLSKFWSTVFPSWTTQKKVKNGLEMGSNYIVIEFILTLSHF